MPSSSGEQRYRRNLFALLFLIAFLILYGSLYPWQFRAYRGLNPFELLLHSWDFEMNRWILRDMAVNIVLYMPLGFIAYLALRRTTNPAIALLMPALIGGALSCTVEIAQAFEPARQTSLLDVATNVFGAIAGAVGAVVLEGIAGPLEIRALSKKRDASALLLLGVFVCWLTFPFFPVGPRMALAKAAAVFRAHSLAPGLVFPAICLWYAAGLLIRAAELGNRRLWAGISLMPLFAQIVIVHHEPSLAVFIGAAIGASLAVLFPPAPRCAAIAVLAAIVIGGLAPFGFSTAPRPFGWIPFGGLLAMDWNLGVIVILRKAYAYGVAIWLIRESGMRLLRAAALVVLILGALEAIQIHIPAHTPEITDPLLGILLGFGIAVFSPSRRKGARSPWRR